MPKQGVRDVIRSRLASESLPRERQHGAAKLGGQPPEAAVTIGSGPAGDCDGCTEPIQPGEAYLIVRCSPGHTIRLHEACERIWEDERHRPIPRRL
jgi:hypothetical protein